MHLVLPLGQSAIFNTLHILIHLILKSYEVGAIIVPTLAMRKLKLAEMK